MKKLTIYNVYVEMQDQAQCDRMKQLCIDNGLNIRNTLWVYIGDYFSFFDVEFGIFYKGTEDPYQTKVTEQEFIELLKNK